MTVLYFLCLSLWPAELFAKEILFPSPTAPVREFKAYLKSHPDLWTASREILNRKPSRESRDGLIQAFGDAQAAFLSHDQSQARARFRDVAAFETQDDWGPFEREILLTARLRLAQLAINPEERVSHLRASAALGDVTPDLRLFPPPLIEEWRKIMESIEPKSMTFPGLGAEWSVVLLNGQPCLENPCLWRWAENSSLRLSFISDRYRPYSTVLISGDHLRASPPLIPWLNGNCASPALHPEAEKLGEPVPFFGLECEASVQRNVRLNIVNQSGPNLPGPRKKSERPLYKSPWLWIGVGALTALVVSQNKGKKETAPTTTYGD